MVRRWARRPLKSRDRAWAVALARGLVRAGVKPNLISLASIAAAALAAYCLLRSFYLAAALLIQLRLLCNLLDGMVAVEGGLGSRSGEIFNDLPDRISDALILVAAGYAATWPSWSHELGWTAALLAILTAYIRVLGGASGLAQDFRGPMAKPHRMAVMTVAVVAAYLDDGALSVGLAVVVAGSFVTAAGRLVRMVRALEDRR